MLTAGLSGMVGGRMRKRWLVRKHVLYSIEKEFLGNSVPTEVPGREFEGSGDLSFMSFLGMLRPKSTICKPFRSENACSFDDDSVA